MLSPAPPSRTSREGASPALGVQRSLGAAPPRPSRASRAVLMLLAAIGASAVVALIVALATYPSDRTPEGAYYRVMIAVNNGRARDFFAYIETPAQHAAYTIGD